MSPTRRAFLGAVALAGAGGAAGCVGGGGGVGGPDGSGGSDRTPKPAVDGFTLQSLSVGGSPGGEVAVRPVGEPALLDFFATWCAPCKAQMDRLRETRATFPDLHMLSITSESDAAAIRDFWTRHEGEWAVASDPRSRALREYGVNNLPTLLVIDAGGEVVWRHQGLASADSIAENVRAAGVSPAEG